MITNLEPLYEYVRTVLGKNGAHGPDHTFRVTRLCEQIGMREGADSDILIPAALLHDIARPREEETGIPHEQEGARMAEEFLVTLGYPKAMRDQITGAIRTHRYRSSDKPVTLEGCILSDADKLDAMGAIGIARAFLTAGERDGDIEDAMYHIEEKLLILKDLMYTQTASEIAGERHEVLNRYFIAIREEMQIKLD